MLGKSWTSLCIIHQGTSAAFRSMHFPFLRSTVLVQGSSTRSPNPPYPVYTAGQETELYGAHIVQQKCTISTRIIAYSPATMKGVGFFLILIYFCKYLNNA